MTNKIPEAQEDAPTLAVGEEFHVLGQAVMLRLTSEYDGTKVVEPGTTLTLSAEMVALAQDDPKGPWTATIADPAAQVARWGRAKFGVGRATRYPWRYKDPRWEAERRAALEVVWAITSPSARARAMAEVHARFAPGQGLEALDND